MRQQQESVLVFDTPSGMGGSFTVSIVKELGDNWVTVRVWYGRATANGWESWNEWDGYTFATTADKLINPRPMKLFK